MRTASEKGLPWRDLGEIDVRKDYLYPDDAVIPCPVEKVEQLSPEQQPVYIQWILHTCQLDHKVDKDPRLYCSYCDMNNHPRFSCKHAFKHRNLLERHHCTLCAAKHPPFLCPRAQVNGGPGQPNWYKAEYKRAKQENREADCHTCRCRWSRFNFTASIRSTTASMCSSSDDAWYVYGTS